MKNKLTSLLLSILIIIPTTMGLVVISSFIFIGFNHYQDFINISSLENMGKSVIFFWAYKWLYIIDNNCKFIFSKS